MTGPQELSKFIKQNTRSAHASIVKQQIMNPPLAKWWQQSYGERDFWQKRDYVIIALERGIGLPSVIAKYVKTVPTGVTPLSVTSKGPQKKCYQHIVRMTLKWFIHWSDLSSCDNRDRRSEMQSTGDTGEIREQEVCMLPPNCLTNYTNGPCKWRQKEQKCFWERLPHG